MNIKTTIFLLVVLLCVGGYVFFTHDKDKQTSDIKPVVKTVVDVKSTDITRFAINGSDGKQIGAQKSTDSSGVAAWKLTQPISAPADSFKISSLLDSLTGLTSTAEVTVTGSDAPHTGLDHPQYTVDLFAGSKETKLLVGDRLAVSDGVYVKLDGHDAVNVVPTAVLDTLEKPANDLRKTQLFETAAPAVQQFTITHKDGSQLVLEKQAKGWQVVKPAATPGDSTAIEDLVSTVINMTPVEFVDDPSQALGLNRPVATVAFSSAAPSTQPTTVPGAPTIIFGGYDDLAKKNVFAQLADGTIVKVAATILDTLNKRPIELRDKAVLDIDPSQVTKLVIDVNQQATTQPTTEPATSKSVALERRKKDVTMGPVMPTTAASQPAVVQTDWTANGNPADDAKITALLGQLHPLKADKYVELPPVIGIKQYTITLTTPSSSSVVTLADPGKEAAVIGTYNGLMFEVPRSIATDLSADFVKAAPVK